VRLITLTGPGGSGKTRLAARFAGHASIDYPDGVRWVDLAVLDDPQGVLDQIARTVAEGLAAADQVEALARLDGWPRSVGSIIAYRRMLLVLDNFEQVLGEQIPLRS
jgi:predicted ATPase